MKQFRSNLIRRRRGFSFTEVLFAVMIMGIGFIMVAAMFPVTIRQTQETMHDTVGANLAKGAAQCLQSIATEETFPPTKTVNDDLMYAPLNSLVDGPSTGQKSWIYSRGNYISPQNPRYAWTALYRRDQTGGVGSGYAQVWIIGMKSWNRPVYETNVDVMRNGTNLATLEPRRVRVRVQYESANLRSTVTFINSSDKGSEIAAPGAYLIIANDNATTSFTGPPAVARKGVANGRIYQLGNPINANTWELSPGGNMIVANNTTPDVNKGDDITLNNADAYIIGRGYTDALNGDYSYSGPSQGISVYTTFIRVN